MSHFRDRFRELFRKKAVLLGGVFALGVVSGALALSLVRPLPPEMESTGGRPLPGKVEQVLNELESISLVRRLMMLNVAREDGALLKMLVEMTGATRALEIGTSNGYSSLWIGAGLQSTGGKLTTLEIDADKVKMARENFEKAGLRDTITVIEGDALKTLPGLKGPFDFVFIDAWKEDYIRYFRTVFPRVTRGGLIIGHNAVEHASTMKDYLDAVTRHPDLETVIISTAGEDGIAISRKAGGGTGR